MPDNHHHLTPKEVETSFLSIQTRQKELENYIKANFPDGYAEAINSIKDNDTDAPAALKRLQGLEEHLKRLADGDMGADGTIQSRPKHLRTVSIYVQGKEKIDKESTTGGLNSLAGLVDRDPSNNDIAGSPKGSKTAKDAAEGYRAAIILYNKTISDLVAAGQASLEATPDGTAAMKISDHLTPENLGLTDPKKPVAAGHPREKLVAVNEFLEKVTDQHIAKTPEKHVEHTDKPTIKALIGNVLSPKNNLETGNMFGEESKTSPSSNGSDSIAGAAGNDAIHTGDDLNHPGNNSMPAAEQTEIRENPLLKKLKTIHKEQLSLMHAYESTPRSERSGPKWESILNQQKTLATNIEKFKELADQNGIKLQDENGRAISLDKDPGQKDQAHVDETYNKLLKILGANETTPPENDNATHGNSGYMKKVSEHKKTKSLIPAGVKNWWRHVGDGIVK